MPDQNLDPLEQRVTALEATIAHLSHITETVTGLRADRATITETLDPNLTAHVAELDAQVERHGLLLARLLDQMAATTPDTGVRSLCAGTRGG
jgi:hypothetical protein